MTRRGVSLIETLLVIFTITVALGAFLFAVTRWLSDIQQNRVGLLAATAVNRRLESLRHQPFAQVTALAPSTPFTEGLEGIPGAQGTVFVCAAYDPALGVCSASGDPNIRQVTVTASVGGRAWRLVTLVSQ
jgi:Tfp pilus assembly protein PilV